MTDPKIAKLIDQGQCQTVVLPPDVRLPGDNVEVRREGEQWVLSPVRKITPVEELDAVFAEIDRLVQGKFMEGGRNQPPMPPEDDLPPVE
jgi:virulence-associated protein VagC